MRESAPRSGVLTDRVTGAVTTLRLGALDLLSCDPETLFTVPDGGFRHVVTVNAEIFVLAHQRREYGDLLASTANTVDGRVVQWLSQLFNRGVPVRKLSGSDFVFDLARLAAQRVWRVFLLGSSEEVNLAARRTLASTAPGIAIDGFSPPIGRHEHSFPWADAALESMARFEPTHLLVALGPPRQEFFIAQNAEILRQRGVQFAAGVGGTLDFVAGAKRRAPVWVQRAGVEWMYRLIREPARFKRTLRMALLPWYAATRRHPRGVSWY